MPDSSRPLLVRRERCPACQRSSARTLYREALGSPGITRYMREHYARRVERDFSGYDYALAQCGHCGLAFQAQVPAPALLEEICDGWLPASEREAVAARWGLDDYRYLAEQVEFMLDHFRLRPGSIKALDFGFGWAEWARMAGAYGVDVGGAALSQVRIDHARSVGIPVVDPDALPQGEFHFINTEQVFEHLLEPGDMLRRLAGALRPGGLVKISVPDCTKSIRKLLGSGNFGALSAGDIMPIAPLLARQCLQLRVAERARPRSRPAAAAPFAPQAVQRQQRLDAAELRSQVADAPGLSTPVPEKYLRLLLPCRLRYLRARSCGGGTAGGR